MLDGRAAIAYACVSSKGARTGSLNLRYRRSRITMGLGKQSDTEAMMKLGYVTVNFNKVRDGRMIFHGLFVLLYSDRGNFIQDFLEI